MAVLRLQVEPRDSRDMEMDFSMASTAKRNEIFFHITSQMASRLQMMDLKIFGTSASLASPTIAPEHLLAKSPVGIPG